MYSSIYSRLIYPAYHMVVGSKATELARELRSHDKLSRDEMRSIESAKLVDLINHARQSVPYYEEVLSNPDLATPTGIDLQQFRKVALLTKAIIRKSKSALVSRSLAGNRVDPNSTSGSTGEPLSFFTDTRSKSYRKAAVARNRSWVGIQNGDPVARLWGAQIDAKLAGSLRGKLHGLVTREIFLSAYELDNNRMAEYARAIIRHKAKLLIGYPSVLQTFGEFCRSESIAIPSLRAIICSAEAMFPFQRHAIESCLSAPVYNRYGCREVGDIAQEVPEQEGLVVNSDRVFVEIIDEKGNPCEPGVMGNILITDLDNYGMPLIRYEIGDRGAWKVFDSARNKYPYPVLESVEGRSLDVVVGPSGNRIGGTFWTILLRMRPGIESFRVIQRAIDSVTVQYKRTPEVPQVDTKYFETKIKEKCGAEMRVVFEEVDSFDIAPGKKFRLVISDIGCDSRQ